MNNFFYAIVVLLVLNGMGILRIRIYYGQSWRDVIFVNSLLTLAWLLAVIWRYRQVTLR